MNEEWDRLLENEYWNTEIMNGAVPICHQGCCYRLWLVISGAERGHIWADDRVDYKGISPVLSQSGRRMTFADWYLDWLLSGDMGGRA